MDIETIKRLPFVVMAYQKLYPDYSTCEICGLPWFVCKSKVVALNDSLGTFAVCEHCWNEATLLEVLEAHTKTYVQQCQSLNKKDRGNYMEEIPLEHVLQCVENEYSNHKQLNNYKQ